MSTVVCKNCGAPLISSGGDYTCPTCGKKGKLTIITPGTMNLKLNGYDPMITIGVKTTETGTVVTKDIASQVEKQLAKNEVASWRSFLAYLKDNVVLDGFEIGYPSG